MRKKDAFAIDDTAVFKTPEGRHHILKQYDRLLLSVEFTYKEPYIETHYGSTYVLESGTPDQPPLFLFHGSSSNSAAWFGNIASLNRFFRVFSVDLIGDAGHSAETRLNMKSVAYARWIAYLFNGTGIEKALIMGNSLGA